MSHPELDAFQAKFHTDALRVHDGSHWTWSVRPVHSTLGAGILSLRRYAPSLAALDAEETAELASMARVIEHALKDAFAFDKINYLMLMMNDPHVHFHVMPRYAEKRTFADIEWVDAGFPALPVLGGEATDRAVLDQVRATLTERVLNASL
jgi:diadenosine tetraphosphate (Ap4A) HIT family hydrolase